MEKYEVIIKPGDISFEVEANELMLDAAIRQGVPIAYSCRNGTCRTCIFNVVAGCVKQEDPDLCMISLQELSENRRLICMSTCSSDVILEKASPRRRNVGNGS